MKLTDVELPSNRKFGFFFTCVFLVLGGYFLLREHTGVSYLFISLAAIFFFTALLKSNWLLPLNRLWMMLGLLIGMVVSPLVLGVIFFGLFTPISLGMKLIGRDELRLKMTARESHWKKRDSESSQTDTFKHQF